MNVQLEKPFENNADADAAFSIVSQLGNIIEQLQLMELASHQFEDAPSGLLGLLGLLCQVYERWDEYTRGLAQRESPEFTALSTRILELVRMDSTLSEENKSKVSALIRDYYR